MKCGIVASPLMTRREEYTPYWIEISTPRLDRGGSLETIHKAHRYTLGEETTWEVRPIVEGMHTDRNNECQCHKVVKEEGPGFVWGGRWRPLAGSSTS